MSSINGTYYICAYTQRTYLQLNDDEPGSVLTAWRFSGDPAQQWRVTPVPSFAEVYSIQNVRYGTYLTWAGGPTTSTVPQYIFQAPMNTWWYAREIQQGYIVVSPDDQYVVTWNVMNGGSGDNNPIIMYPLNARLHNSIWAVISTDFVRATAPSLTLSSIPMPTLASSTSIPGSALSSSSFSSSFSSASSSSSSSSPSSPSTTAQPSPGGLTTDNKIGLGVGIGFGVPTLILTIWALVISVRAANGYYQNKNKGGKWKQLPVEDVEMPQMRSWKQ